MEGERYTTEAIPEEELSDKYELVGIPENAEGIYRGEEIIVTYYYKKVRREVVINKYDEDGTTPLEGVKFTITQNIKDSSEVEEITNEEEIVETGKIEEQTELPIYTTNAQGKIELELEVGRYEITEIETKEGYQLPEDEENNVIKIYYKNKEI
ncbi:MAG: MucBP domain-containing protein [Clostridia bacterium]|nr:MucBP domain-containing protein [Clostridia bacterium]